MTKADLSKALSLSCVENYFLAYYKDKLDIRQLYVQSFVPINKVLNDCITNNIAYENYPLVRVQETSEKLGLTTHKLTANLNLKENSLNLIRVNKRFFENSKLESWRTDHYIAIQSTKGTLRFLNNYPLAEGELLKERLLEIYDGAIINFNLADSFAKEEYERLSCLQFSSIIYSSVNDFKLCKEDILKLRSAILVLKTLRKRLAEWLSYSSEKGAFITDVNFQADVNNLIACYDKTFIVTELQLNRGTSDIDILQAKLAELLSLENELLKQVNWRRIVNEHTELY